MIAYPLRYHGYLTGSIDLIHFQSDVIMKMLSATLFISLTTTTHAQHVISGTGSEAIFSKGNRAPASNFTGTAWVQLLVFPDSTYTTSVGSVRFEPGARTNRSAVRWHSHQAGQLLLITDGEGLYQEQGIGSLKRPIQRLHKGDIIKCQPDITHWHGASSSSPMTHIAINPNTEKGIVVWKKFTGSTKTAAYFGKTKDNKRDNTGLTP